MTTEINTQHATVNILMEIAGEIHMVGMNNQEQLDAINFFVKRSVSVVIPTGKTQQQLNEFLGYKG